MAEAAVAVEQPANPVARVAHAPADGILPLQVRDLAYDAGGTRLVDGLSFDLAGGGLHVLVGPNGAGKSLTLRLLHGLLTPTAGAVLWNGRPPDRRVRLRQAMVFQKPVVLRRSVRANVTYALRAHGVSRRERAQRTDAVLAKAGLDHVAERPARVLSGGEQQRLAVARAWAVRPEVLFLDEPTANLDPAATQTVEALIGDIRSQGTTILIATHDMGQVRRLGDEVLFLHRGRLQERSDAATFFAAPRSEAGRAYLAGRLLV
jgi:tungstate transport system ATP-binding protein